MRRRQASSTRLSVARRSLVALLAFPLLVVVFPHAARGLDYPSDFKFIEVPDPLSGDNPGYPLIAKTEPSPGQSWNDLRFGTVQSRVTQTPAIRHEYSRIDPFNCDQTLILLQNLDPNNSSWAVYRTRSKPYDQPGNQVIVVNLQERSSSGEMRWDPVKRNLLWCLRDLQVITLDVETGNITVIKDFSLDSTIGPIIKANPYLYRITNMDEGESSRDKRYWVFALQNGADPKHHEWDYVFKYLFTWDLVQNQVPGTYQLSLDQGSNLDWVGMSTL
ncbi:MAG: hypothetical protein ABSG91_23315, partial [Syntrophobacteraceae bacterium]